MRKEYNSKNIQILSYLKNIGDTSSKIIIDDLIYEDVPSFIISYTIKNEEWDVMMGTTTDEWPNAWIVNSTDGHNDFAVIYIYPIGYCKCFRLSTYNSYPYTVSIKYGRGDSFANYNKNSQSIDIKQSWNRVSLSNGGRDREVSNTLPLSFFTMLPDSIFYGCSIYSDNTFSKIEHKFLPAKNGDEFGLYDTITNKFYKNIESTITGE